MKTFVAILLILVTVVWLMLTNVDLMHTAAGMLEQVSVEMAARYEMHRVGAIVRDYAYEHGSIPRGSLHEVVRASVKSHSPALAAEIVTDPWGTRYQLVPGNRGCHINSAGPDREWNTSDDIRYFQGLVKTRL